MKKLLIISSCLIICGCINPEYIRNKAKRKVERLIKTYSLDKDTIKTESIDTVYRTDTLVIPEIVSENIFSYVLDTMYVIDENGIRTEIKIQKDTVYLKNTVHKRDTVILYKDIIKTVTNTVPIDITKEVSSKRLGWLFWIFIWLIILFIAIKTIKGIKNV